MGTTQPESDLYPAQRLGLAAAAAGQAGLAALFLTPGPDLRYLTGYDAQQLERLTCLVVPAAGGGGAGAGRAASSWRSSRGRRPTTPTRWWPAG